MNRTDAKRLMLAWLASRLEFEGEGAIVEMSEFFGRESSYAFAQLADARRDLIAEMLRRSRRRSMVQTIQKLMYLPWWSGKLWVPFIERIPHAQLADKAQRFDLDQAGIGQREAEAVELVELRAEVARRKEMLVKLTKGVEVQAKRRDKMPDLLRQAASWLERDDNPSADELMRWQLNVSVALGTLEHDIGG